MFSIIINASPAFLAPSSVSLTAHENRSRWEIAYRIPPTHLPRSSIAVGCHGNRSTVMGDEQLHHESIQAIFDRRSEGYDNSSFHVDQARAYASWTDLKPGQAALDLACGTGLVTLLLKEKVGIDGKVVGVDISEGMLEVARRKAARDGIEVDFIDHDITKLRGFDFQLPPNLPGFHSITCASALVILQDPPAALKDWAQFLLPGGRLIIDAPTEDSDVTLQIMASVGKRLGHPVGFNRSWVVSEESLRKVLAEAGLVVDVFVWSHYGEKEFDVSEAHEVFEELLTSAWFSHLAVPAIKDQARSLFVEEFEQMASPSGKFVDYQGFYIGIGRKE